MTRADEVPNPFPRSEALAEILRLPACAAWSHGPRELALLALAIGQHRGSAPGEQELAGAAWDLLESDPEDRAPEALQIARQVLAEDRCRERGLRLFGHLLSAELAPPDWQVEGLWQRGDVVLLAGPPGYAKSYLAIAAALNLSVGRNLWGGFPVPRPGRAAYLDAEMSPRRFQVRLGRLVRGLEAPPPSLDGRAALWSAPNLCADDPQDWERLRESLLDLARSGDGLDLVVLDSFRRFLAGDEQDSGAISRFFSALWRLRDELGGPSFLLTHHTRKRSKEQGPDPADRIRGSSDLRAASDCVLLVDQRYEGGRYRVLNPKNRDAEAPPFVVRLDGWTDSPNGEPATPLRPVLEAGTAAELVAGHAVEAALVSFLEAQPGRRATRQAALASLQGIAQARAATAAFRSLKDRGLAASKTVPSQHGREAVWYMTDPADRLDLDAG